MEFLEPEKENKRIAEFNKRFPYKVELHVHLDGAVRPGTVIDIARERGMLDSLPHKTAAELNRDVILSEPCSLERLLQSFTYFMPIICGYKPALSRVAYELCEECDIHRIKYMECRYSPHLFSNSVDNPIYCKTKGEFTPHDVVQTVNEALARGMKKYNVTVTSILCCLTDKPEWAAEVLELCNEFKNQGVVGIDIAGQEFHPGVHPDDCELKTVFKRAAELGIRRTVHAGEIGTSQAVQEALDDMKAERIGHGYHAIDDKELYKKIIESQVHLETCPISSIITRACERTTHPLLQFVRDGANYSINTDDPVVLGNTLTDDFVFAKELGLSDDDIIRGIFNAARSSFAPKDTRERILCELADVYGPH